MRADLLDDHRREALGRLVEQQELGAGAQDAADRQHLLLAARELGALAAEPLVQIGEQLEHVVAAEAARRAPAAAASGSPRPTG